MNTMRDSGHYLGKSKETTFSEQHIVDCCDVPRRCDMGCNGGYPWNVYDFVNRNGLYLEKNYPYRAL
jgi:hypothetical protein